MIERTDNHFTIFNFFLNQGVNKKIVDLYLYT